MMTRAAQSHHAGCVIETPALKLECTIDLTLLWCFQVYRNNKAAIDPILEKVKAQYKEVSDKVGAMLPQGKAAPEAKKEE